MNITNVSQGTIRIPRPHGSTSLAQACTQKGDYTNLYSHLLAHYINNGFTYLGRELNSTQFSEATGLSEEAIHNGFIESSGMYTKMLDSGTLEKTLRALFSRALVGSLSDRATVQNFVQLLGAQAVRKPSGYVSLKEGYLYQKGLDTLLKSQDQFLKILSALMPKGNTFIFGGEAKGPKDTEYITRDEALERLSEGRNPLMLTPKGQESLPMPAEAQSLFDTYQLGTIPEIRANITDADNALTSSNLIAASDEMIEDVEAIIIPDLS